MMLFTQTMGWGGGGFLGTDRQIREEWKETQGTKGECPAQVDHGCFSYYYCKTDLPAALQPETGTIHPMVLTVSVGQEPKNGFVGWFQLGASPDPRQMVAAAAVVREGLGGAVWGLVRYLLLLETSGLSDALST